MALIIKDRVKEITTTTGTGDVSLGGTSATFDAFQSVMSNGDTTFYAIVHTASGTDEWEVGVGTWNTGNTLTRTTVYAGSNGTSAVNFSSGNKDIFMTYPASKAAVAGEDVTFADVTATDITATGTVTLSGDPTSALQAATKEYVDTIAAAGIHYHTPVRVEAPSALTATYDNGTSGVGATLTNSGTQAALVIDGVTLSTSDRVLVYNQTNAAHNGVYTVTNTGSASTNWVLTRATDADSYGASDPDALGEGDAYFVKEGDTGAGELYVMNTSGVITFGTTNITFTVIAETAVYSAGTGLTLTGTTFSTNQDISTSASPTFNNITVTGTVDGRDVATDGSKLDGIEAGATADQTAAEIKTAYESNSDTNAFTDAEQTKLSGIETGATGDQTASEILTAIKTVDGAGSNLDADLLDGQQGSYYLNTSTTFSGDVSGTYGAMVVADDSHNHVISNVDGLQTALDGKTTTSRTITAGSGLTGGGDFTANRTINVGAGGGITVSADAVSHADTSSQASVNNSNGTVIQDVTLDTYGHVTGLTSANLDGRYYTETEADSRFANVSGDTFTGNVSIDAGTSGDAILTIRSDTDNNAEGDHPSVKFLQDGDLIGYRIGIGASDGDVSVAESGNGLTITNTTSNSFDSFFWSPNNGTNAYKVFHDSYHPNADKWTTARTLSLSGDASGSVSWDGSANATLSVTVADDSHNHTISNIDNLSVGTLTGMRLTTTSGYIEFGPANTTWAHIYTDRPNFYFNKDLYVLGARVYNTNYHPEADTWTTARTLSLSGDASGSVSWDGSANATLSVTVSDNSHNHSSSSGDFSIGGALTINGSTTRGTYTSASQYHSGADNIVLKGNSSGISSIFFESEKDGTNINHTSDFGFIQFHPYGTGTSGEANELIIGVSNDADDHVIINAPNANGLKFRTGASATDYTVWHAGNDGSGSGLDADTVDGIQASSFLRSDANDTTSGVITFGPNTNWSRYLKIGGNANNSDTASASIGVTNGNLHIDAAQGSYATYLNYYDGTAGVAFGNGASGIVAYMGPDGDLWKGSVDNSGSKYWHAGNDGASSGLDADLLDGQHGSYYAAASSLGSYVAKNTGYIWTGVGGNALSFQSNDTLETGTGDQAALEVYQDTSGADAFMQFHVSGDYAAYFGLKGDINDFAVGGWSMGANVYHRLWHAGNDGSGSGLDADTVDGVHGSSFLRNDANQTASGVITLSSYARDALNFSGNTLEDNRGVAFNGRIALSADYNDGYLRLNNASEFGNGIFTPGNFRADGWIEAGSGIRHQGDTNTNVTFGTDTVTIIAGGQSEVTVNSTGVRLGDTGNGYFQPVSGDYGSVQIDGGAHNSWEGYSIGGRAVFMHDNGYWAGLYDDVNNNWIIQGNFGGNTYLYHNGSYKLYTTSSGVTVSGTVSATSYTGDGSSLTGISAGATGGGSDEIFWENGQTVTTNYTITNGKNAMSAGPITVNSGVTVTVGSGETWTVV